MSKLAKLASKGITVDREDNNREVILAYLEAGGVGIELSELQQKLLERWERADELIKRNIGKKNREEVANLLKSIYKYHRATAYKDMMDAEYVFASSKPWNKKYLVGIRIEYCMKRIKDAQESGDAKLEAAFEQLLQKYIEMYPDDLVLPGSQSIIFNIDNRTIQGHTINTEDAEAIIESALINLPNGKSDGSKPE